MGVRCPKPNLAIRLLRVLFGQRLGRVSGLSPRMATCEWCGKEEMTAINEIWCNADTTGNLTRLCKDCADANSNLREV